jgi:hexosaminidase
MIRRATGATPRIVTSPPEPLPQRSFIALSLVPGKPATPVDLGVGPEGYDLIVRSEAVLLRAETPAGLFYGTQTLRQLLPYSSEYEAILYQRPRPATLPALHVRDTPRYQWRGAMLDVARHFFTVAEVKQFIDLLALHKLNRLHLHLADDQGWRIEIKKWPELTAQGGQTEVGGTPGGFYTQAQYADLVAYAADRFITIVPEIDMPGHTNAALSSISELNCNGRATPRFTGTDVGFSALCVDLEFTYKFLDDVITEIAAMTPGAYFHAGGDEVKTLKPEQYRAFIERVQTIVQAHGKQLIGWDEIAAVALAPTSIVQHWRPDAPKADLARAPRLILSPADRTYPDMKYDRETALGLDWAALVPVQRSYDWDPATLVPGAAEVLGVEAPLWSETVATMRDVEFLAMPRLAAIAEVAWSPQAARAWDGFRVRLGAQAPRWSALGINFYRAPEIPWAR